MSGSAAVAVAPVKVLQVALAIDDAFALAELCKRITWSACREISVSDDEAYRMIHATDQVRAALVDARVVVR